jgi:sugar-specific transcriptional regulator TrmB
MDKQHLEEILIENGFTDKESAVYIAALELGSTPISSIARRLKQHRVTIYSILKNFVARGIAQTTSKNKTKYYSMIPPQQLVEKMSEKIRHLEGVIPELMALANKIDTPVKAQFYEGLE